MVAPRFLFARAALASAFLASTGCSLVVKTDAEQCAVDTDCTARGVDFAGTVCLADICQAKPVPPCAVDADCTARGPDFADTVCVEKVCQPDPKWSCLGHVNPLMAGSTVTVSLRLVDLLTTAPVTSVTVKLCSKYDPPCNSPLGMPKVGADGYVSAKIASDFQGYFDIQGPGYQPSLAFIDAVGSAEKSAVQLVPNGAAAGLAMGAKVTLDPTAGIVLSLTADCMYKASSGVSVSIFPSSKETGFYVIASGVSPGATVTDSAGNAGFVNVVPGTPTLTATRGPGGQEIGKVTTLVRAGSVTYQVLPPTP